MPESTGSRVDCPVCGEEFDPEAAGGWCTNSECGEYQHDGEDVPDPSEADAGSVEDASPLTECPGCGVDVDPEDSFCASCGEDLDAHRAASPSGGSESAASDESSTGRAMVAEPDGPPGDSAPETLRLATRGRELEVEDGDTAGRELRRIVTETGGDEEDAVRIHREHVRFVREDGQFYLVDLGENPTQLNGEALERGDSEPVSPGDEIELSGVVGIAVRKP